MTEQNPYPAQVADLIAGAFERFDANTDALEVPDVERAVLQMQAAQAIATLALASETRIQSFITLAGLKAVGGEAPNPEIARQAYTAAAIALGLVDGEPDQADIDDLMAALRGDDPADKDLGDLP